MHYESLVGVEISYGMEPLYKIVAIADLIDDGFRHPGHYPHANSDISYVSELDASFGIRRIRMAHHVRQDIHGPSPHAAPG